jgi:hypothetical protein
MGCVAHTREMINAYIILVEKQKRRDHLRPSIRSEDNIEI